MFKNNKALPEEQWSYSVIETIFDYVKEETGNQSTLYSMFGHSAGAQFVHRFVTFKQNTRLDKAIAANSGWYTVPDTQIEYPYGLKNSGFSDKPTLTHLFSSNLIVALGDKDTDPNDSSLRHTPEADAQGLYRYARGEHYYTQSQQNLSSQFDDFQLEKSNRERCGTRFRGNDGRNSGLFESVEL